MMKRCLSVLLIVFLLLPVSPSAETAQAMPADLKEWMAAFQRSYQNSDPAALKPIVPVAGWLTYVGGDWSYQYPPDWTVLSGDAYSFMACDSRRLAFFDFAQVRQFNQPYTHDQLGAWVFSRVAGETAPEVAGTFQKNIFPNLTLTPPEGIAQVWFIRWRHPQAGRMFTLMELSFLAWRDFTGYGVPGISGSVSASWTAYTAPEAEFAAVWANTFNPMFLSASYTIPGGGETDTDGDGHPDSQDNYPEDPNYY